MGDLKSTMREYWKSYKKQFCPPKTIEDGKKATRNYALGFEKIAEFGPGEKEERRKLIELFLNELLKEYDTW